MESVLRQFKTKIESWKEWHECKVVVLAISGGVDSMVLLHLMLELTRLQEYRQVRLIVAHFNHRLRSDEVHAIEQKLVVETAKAHDLIYFVCKWQEPTKTNVEANARKARYQFLADVVQACEADCLMTAHHMDDAVETMLMRIVRGTSFKGLIGINANYRRLMQTSSGEVVFPRMLRPLITQRKEALYQYAADHHIDYFDDETNQELEYLRNRVRNLYLPQFEEENPQFFHNLISMQEQMQSVYQAHYQGFIAIEPYLLVKIKERDWVLDVEAWQKLSEDLRHVYLTIFFEERLVHEIGQYDKEAILYLDQQITNQLTPNYSFNLASGWISRREYQYIYIESELKGIEQAKPNQVVDLLSLNKWHSLGDGMWIGIFNEHFVSNQMKQAVDAYYAMDLSSCEVLPKFHVRHRRDGDVIQLRSNEGTFHKKVSRILIDEKVPLLKRESMWLVVNDQEEVIWMIGQQKSSRYLPERPEQITHHILIQKMY